MHAWTIYHSQSAQYNPPVIPSPHFSTRAGQSSLGTSCPGNHNGNSFSAKTQRTPESRGREVCRAVEGRALGCIEGAAIKGWRVAQECRGYLVGGDRYSVWKKNSTFLCEKMTAQIADNSFLRVSYGQSLKNTYFIIVSVTIVIQLYLLHV